MKIAQIVCVYPPYRGGIGSSAKAYTEYLKNRGHDVTVFSPVRANDSIDEEVRHMKPILKHGHGGLFRETLKHLNDYDLLILHYPFFGFSEQLFLKYLFGKNNPRLLIFYHMDTLNLGFLNNLLSIPSRLIKNALFKKADKVLCSSLDYIKSSQVQSIFEAMPEKFVELPFAVDSDKFFPDESQEKEGRIIGFVGGLDRAHYFKGVDVLIKAFSSLSRKDLRLKIIGNGEMLGQYKRLAQERGIADRVEFLCNINNEQLREQYRQMDVLVLPSINRHEAFGIVLLEAMSSAVPVIASRLPGVASVFSDQEQGFFTEPGSVEDLADKITMLMNHESRRKEMGRKGRELVLEKYTKKTIGDKLNEIVEKTK